MSVMIKTEELYRSYKPEIEVLKGINLEIKEKEFVAIMGQSGSGKTTLLKLLGLIDLPTKGSVYFMGTDTRNIRNEKLAQIRRDCIGYIYQDYYLMDSLTVLENIMLPMILDHAEDAACYGKGRKIAAEFGLSHLLEKNPFELSGGEKQRVAICRALINNPEVIFADEPTGNLDSKTSQNVIETLRDINKNREKTILLVTHDPKMASYCDRIVVLKDGEIVNGVRHVSYD